MTKMGKASGGGDGRGPVAGGIGDRLMRVEDRPLLTGVAEFVDDLPFESGLEVAFVRSNVAHGRLLSSGIGGARGMPGVEGAFDAADLGLPPLLPPNDNPDVRPPAQPVLATGKVRFAGEPLAVVAATDRYLAEDACGAVIPEIEELEQVLDARAAIEGGSPEIHEGSNAVVDTSRDEGEVDAAFEQADVVIERTFTTPRHSAMPIEARAVLARPDGDGVEVWTSSQGPHKVRQLIAEILGLDPGLVRVVTPDVGGGFGVKAHVYPEEIALAALAMRLGRPVKWIEDRAENLAASTHARAQDVQVRAAMSAQGDLLAMDVDLVCDQGAYGAYPHGVSLDAMTTSGMLPGPYRLRNFRVRVRTAVTNKSPQGAYRGVGFVPAAFIHERTIEVLAREAGLDPAEVRRRNLIDAEELPYVSITHQPYDSGDYRQALALALDQIGYAGIESAKRTAASEGRRTGLGLACYVEPTGMNSKVFKMRGMIGIEGFDAAHVTLEADGIVRVWTTTPAIGQGSDTTLSQMAAQALGMDASMVRLEHSDTGAAELNGTGTFASRSAVSTGGAVTDACGQIRDRLVEDASDALEAASGDLVISGPSIHVKGSAAPAVQISELVAAAPERYRLSATHDPEQPVYPYATHACLVSVDEETGEVVIDRYVIVEDCGTIINPTIVEGQVHGAAAQGIGGVLYEGHDYDEQGQLRTATLLDYLVPTATEIPAVELTHLEIPSPSTAAGVKGCGEGGTIAPAPAIANAVGDALGVEFNHFPITPEQVRDAARASVLGKA
jgi:aerobic carbon-monoxide dehydrogenase large subunit